MSVHCDFSDNDIADLVEGVLSGLENASVMDDDFEAIHQEVEFSVGVVTTLKDTTGKYSQEHSAVKNDLQLIKEQMLSDKENMATNGALSVNITRVEDIHNNIKKRDLSASEKLSIILTEKESMAERENNLNILQAEADRARSYFNLYRNMTSLVWDQSSKDNVCKGFISKINDVKPFCLNREETSGFTIANYLWSLVEEN